MERRYQVKRGGQTANLNQTNANLNQSQQQQQQNPQAVARNQEEEKKSYNSQPQDSNSVQEVRYIPRSAAQNHISQTNNQVIEVAQVLMAEEGAQLLIMEIMKPEEVEVIEAIEATGVIEVEEVIELEALTENQGVTEMVEVTLETEVVEVTLETEVVEVTLETEVVEATERTEEVEATERTEVVEATERTEVVEVTEGTEVGETTQMDRSGRGNRVDRGNFRGRGIQPQNNDRQLIQDREQIQPHVQNERPFRQRTQQDNRRPRYFTVDQIQQLLDKPLAEIVEQLTEYPQLSQSIDATNYSSNTYQDQRTTIYSAFNDSDFYQNLQRNYFTDLNISIRSRDEYLQKLEELDILIEVFSLLVDKFRTSANIYPVLQLKSFLKDELPDIQVKHDFIGYSKPKVQELQVKAKALKQKVRDARTLVQQQEEVKIEEVKRRQNQINNRDEDYKQQAPNDFRLIRVVPTIEELSQRDRPFLRAIPSGEARFRNPQDYLDLIFRLLREDAICPLRKGYQLMKRQHQLDQNTFRLEMRNTGCRLYDNVVIQDVSTSRNSQEMVLTLRIFERRNQNWLTSKRLLNGSLLMISKDNFNTLDFCIVADKDPKEMANTSLRFKFVDIQVQLIKSDANNHYEEDENPIQVNQAIDFYVNNKNLSFQMIESSAYFEAYNHILHKLKEMASWNTLPFEKYLLGLQKNIDSPPLWDSLSQQQRAQLQNSIRNAILDAKLDQSQVKAINSCFYKELAIIQGPPGTGKTYVGEHFVRILMQNIKLWRKQKGPILLVCYTNHALDQFLNLIKKYTQNFIRFGGRCKDEGLSKHQIREFIRSRDDLRYPIGYRDCIQDLDDIQLKVADQKLLFQFNTLGVMNKLVDFDEKVLDGALNAITKEFHRIANQTAAELYRFQQMEAESQQQLEYQKSVYENVRTHIYSMLEKDSDISVVFWLGIIDTQKYVEDIWDWYMSGNNVEEPDINEDDFDQRELDYIQGNMNTNLTFKQRKRIYLSIRDKIRNLTQQYDPYLQSDFFGNSKTIQECIQIGQRIQGINHYSANFQPFNLTLNQRWQLNNYFLAQNRSENPQGNLVSLASQYESIYKRKKQLDTLTQVKAIRKADVVAMTTTGCAKFNDILRNVQFSIVIVEEAAEVFEAHIISSLSEHSEHLVLIGDHQQLKPAPAVYELEKKYNLSMSLFERLVKNDYEYTTLSTQRRMRPEISSIVKLIYPNLVDGEKVLNYPVIRGIDKSLYFFDHENQEDRDEGLMSKFNKFESNMIERFTKYLLQQNYKPERITILSLYMAQSLHIKRQIMEKYPRDHEMRNVKVITVDNFQGEENDIIILSLVRSNQSNQIGYLKVSNRVCVALSRAKHGMYIFGNATCLYKHVDRQMNQQHAQVEEQQQLWLEVLNYLKEKQFIGETLNLCCEKHKNVTTIKNPEDFQNVPEGGCKLPCNARLNCGHSCESICHYYEITPQDSSGHKKTKCLKQCERENPCGHPCSFKCFECIDKLQPCQTMIDKTFDICGHSTRVKCHLFDTAKCYDQCQKVKPCGHNCQKYCHVDCSQQKCGVNVLKRLPCGHEMELKCYQTPEDFVANDRFGCPKKCDVLLDCGHPCKETCGSCTKNIFHKTCEVKLDKAYQCGHVKSQFCGTLSVLCQQKCENKCIHNHCPKKCYEPCDLCLEPCLIQCEHSKCGKKCSQPCNKELCIQRCDLILECSHRCIGLCGDQCPKICKVCQPDHETFEIFFGYEQEPETTFVQIDCGHILDAKSLDTYISTQQYQNSINQTLQDMNQIKLKTLKQHEQLMVQFDTLPQKFKQLQGRLHEIKIEKQFKIQQVFKLWESIYRKSNDNESLLKDCTIKLELMSFIIAFGNYIHQYDQHQQNDASIYSFCQVSIEKILSKRFALPEGLKSIMRTKAELIDREYNFKATMQMVIKALNLGPGHYYKCPNGHYYAIGDCGGAMEVSKCPDCGATIGGSNHALVQGNQHAGEFDNSSRAAWDTHGFDQQVLNGQVDLNEI
eukprot:403366003